MMSHTARPVHQKRASSTFTSLLMKRRLERCRAREAIGQGWRWNGLGAPAFGKDGQNLTKMPAVRRYALGLRSPYDAAVGRPQSVQLRCARRTLWKMQSAKKGAVPRLPHEFEVEFDRDGWRH